MMHKKFIELHVKGESCVVNTDKILFVHIRKNGTRLELDDGTPFDVDEPYQSVLSMLPTSEN